jgi:PadR family transcriptional regulator, regulatory protein PadR
LPVLAQPQHARGYSVFDIASSRLYLAAMATRIRLTAVIMDVLDVLTNAPLDDPAWGLRLCEQTGYGTGTVYPALDRLMKAGWINDHWEDPPPADRPRRRFYKITSTGREQYEAALRARGDRRARWLHPRPGIGIAP